MTHRIVYQGDDGIAKVVCPTPEFLASGRPLSSLRGRPKDGRPERVVDSSEIPTDRTFRNAWELDENEANPPCKCNMTKATDIAKDRVRQVRKPKFEELDIAMLRAMEAGDTVKIDEIKTKKQKLRDATADTRITDATDPDTLKRGMEEVQSEIERTTA